MTTKVALDTSVVVAAMLPQHPRHGPCAGWLRRGEQGEITLTIAVHGIAESFATLTARAPNLSVPPRQAVLLIRHLLGYVEPIDVSSATYVDLIARSLRMVCPAVR